MPGAANAAEAITNAAVTTVHGVHVAAIFMMRDLGKGRGKGKRTDGISLHPQRRKPVMPGITGSGKS
jgi:hypothetical protein